MWIKREVTILIGIFSLLGLLILVFNSGPQSIQAYVIAAQDLFTEEKSIIQEQNNQLVIRPDVNFSLYDSNGSIVNKEIIAEISPDGRFLVTLVDQEDLPPGIYTLRMEYIENGEVITGEQIFLWE